MPPFQLLYTHWICFLHHPLSFFSSRTPTTFSFGLIFCTHYFQIISHTKLIIFPFHILAFNLTHAHHIQDSEPDGPVRSLSSSPQVSLDILSDESDVCSSTNANLQCAHIARIVTKKDLRSLFDFGDVQGIAEALGTDLEKGILGDAQDLRSRHLASAISQTEPATKTFFQCLLKACNNSMIVLLLVSMVLSLWYWIKKVGLGTGWYEGFVILVAIIILVVCHSIRDFWHETQHKLSEKKLLKMTETVVQVFRGGCSFLCVRKACPVFRNETNGQLHDQRSKAESCPVRLGRVVSASKLTATSPIPDT